MQTKRCKSCKQKKRLTLFTLRKDARDIEDLLKKRQDICRACNYDGLTADQRHLILRESYRNYLTFEQYVTDTGKDIIEYASPVSKGSDEVIDITISFTELQRALRMFNDTLQQQGTVLSKRKEQAFYLNVIRDMKQKEVAKLMKITTVSVGQYVDQAVLQLSEYYFADSHGKVIDEDT